MASSILPCILLITVLFGLASSDVNQDKAECKNHLMGLAPCLSFVDGEAKTPTVDCCGGLKQVLGKSKKCLCVVIRDRDDSSAGLKINATLAAALPSACRAKVNMTDCISLLHLAPNSQEAKLFEGYQKLTERNPIMATTTPSTTGKSTGNGAEKSGGGKGNEMALGASLWVFTMLLLNFGV
ncbi:hypothetical protein E1A91_D08G017000v1 [Gossypium mustelinum]|uniref:Bifunctional inhibitor/plant lipid transfer protein/seed storage helical domain-containing protein n=3 Tax=Gossypium TaxID=3633 RepID=A0A5J5Q8G9_GOSBA|nr:hypothetical protein ES319_D08G016600v1 [Gossypium barbadense]PPD81784.1 hypothetical protein GOBAR_DD21301 [Gossypium barbadense]TYG55868.1 hypothetical protein ES288_D08G017600v1 [Gossypium darwinii]TYI67424.1 hypothetical protein E1A91_D08G017000v1 [Gossypium mustelinum]